MVDKEDSSELVVRSTVQEIEKYKGSCINKIQDTLSDIQKNRVEQWMKESSHSFCTETSMICKGKKSKCHLRCIFTDKENIDKSTWPVGQYCPMESIRKAERIFQLCAELKLENIYLRSSDFWTILKIADFEIIIDDIIKMLKDEGIAVDDLKIIQGMPYKERKSNPLFPQLFKAIEERDKLLDSLLISRKSYIDAMTKVRAVQMTDVKDKIREDYIAIPRTQDLKDED